MAMKEHLEGGLRQEATEVDKQSSLSEAHRQKEREMIAKEVHFH